MTAEDVPGQGSVIDLWPTKYYQRLTAAFDEPNRLLLKLVRDLEKSNRGLTTDYRENNILNLDTPGANWLRHEVNQSVIEYLQIIGINYPVNWQIHAWPNINRFGDYHDAHNHPRAYLSGTYYVKMPTTQKPGRNRSDLRPGHITFYDPRSGINMNSINNDPYIDPEHTICPVPGQILMWPGFLNHFVHPNLSDETRISISFNIVLKWSDEYLPTQ